MSNPYTIIELEQNTAPWLEYRRSRLGASDVASVLKISPWRSRYALFLEKTGKAERQKVNAAMKRGMELENEAKELAEKELGMRLNPIVLESIERPYMCASLDGLSDDGMTAVEIKCPSDQTHTKALLNDELEPHYYAQVQAQLYVTGLNSMIYFSYGHDGSTASIEVPRNEFFIQKMIIACDEFWAEVQGYQEPEVEATDHLYIESKEFRDAEEEYVLASDALEQEKGRLVPLEKRLEEAKARMLELTDGLSCMGDIVRITIYETKGRVNYSKLIKDKELETIAETYRGKPIVCTRITNKFKKEKALSF